VVTKFIIPFPVTPETMHVITSVTAEVTVCDQVGLLVILYFRHCQSLCVQPHAKSWMDGFNDSSSLALSQDDFIVEVIGVLTFTVS